MGKGCFRKQMVVVVVVVAVEENVAGGNGRSSSSSLPTRGAKGRGSKREEGEGTGIVDGFGNVLVLLLLAVRTTRGTNKDEVKAEECLIMAEAVGGEEGRLLPITITNGIN